MSVIRKPSCLRVALKELFSAVLFTINVTTKWKPSSVQCSIPKGTYVQVNCRNLEVFKFLTIFGKDDMKWKIVASCNRFVCSLFINLLIISQYDVYVPCIFSSCHIKRAFIGKTLKVDGLHSVNCVSFQILIAISRSLHRNLLIVVTC